MTTERQTRAETIRGAEEVRDALATALERAGLRLPSLRLDPSTYADANPRPLIELGRCSPPLARELAALIDRGAAR
ncbi:hypothetical protein [Streptomyces sp. TRM68367]|uniref:hypothetical protein n=1 Tax=Streptomyces sp. TRM68367 TaxID=2758415 RepID=UPI00165A74FA|nr:hypothetical protein [Streptomyces sp. TRM68367]MBC9727351.1 hypothetical protein [Streptomyces sp. TRM68367]